MEKRYSKILDGKKINWKISFSWLVRSDMDCQSYSDLMNNQEQVSHTIPQSVGVLHVAVSAILSIEIFGDGRSA